MQAPLRDEPDAFDDDTTTDAQPIPWDEEFEDPASLPDEPPVRPPAPSPTAFGPPIFLASIPKRFPVLRFLAMLSRCIAYMVIAAVIVIVAVAVDRTGMSAATGAVGLQGATWLIGALVYLVTAESIHVWIDAEHNTRSCAVLLERLLQNSETR